MSKVLRVAIALSFIALSGAAFAHAKLRSSSPANNATVTVPPASLTLVFNKDVRLAMLNLATDSKQIPISVDPSAAAKPAITVKLPPLRPGKYQVNWSALSPNDGHIVKGSFSFSIAPPK
jgi:methionine-rich copper-binding protein CopC